ncbi:MAG: ribonuclease H-like domain-containing protein [archaeon]
MTIKPEIRLKDQVQKDYITAQDFYQYYDCWKKLSFESLPEEERKKIKGPMHEFNLYLMALGQQFEKEVIAKIGSTEKVTFIPRGRKEIMAKRTLKAMERGDNLIYQGVIIDEERTLMGQPDLMIRVNRGKSKFGKYHYQPIDIKSSLEIRGEQIMQVVHYEKILEVLQGMHPENAFIYSKSRDKNKLYEKTGFNLRGSMTKFLDDYKRVNTRRKDLNTAVDNLEDETSTFKGKYGSKKKTNYYYQKRKTFKTELVKIKKQFKSAEYKLEPIKNQKKMFEKSPTFEDSYESIMKEVIAIREGKSKPTPTIASPCVMCEYKPVCKEEAEKINDVSIASGVGSGAKRSLMDAKLLTIDDFVNVGSEIATELEKTNSITSMEDETYNSEKVSKFIKDVFDEKIGKVLSVQAAVTSALAWKEKRMLTYKDNDLIKLYGGKLLEKPDMYEPECAIQIDFETDQASDKVIMNGLNIKHDGKQWTKTFFAETPKQDGKIFFEFLDYVKELPEDVKFYHWSAFEHTHFERMFDNHYAAAYKRYGNEFFDLEDKVMDNLVDLLPMAKHSMAAPVSSYSIKTLLPEMFDFHWREDSDAGKVDGAKFQVLYEQFMETSDKELRNHLQAVMIEYNEDDVLGPWHVYDKIVELSK